MGIAQDKAISDYARHLGGHGVRTGGGMGEAMLSGFMDGFTRGHRDHANIVVQSLQVLLDEFQEPVSIKSARERVEQLQLAIKHGSEL